MKIFAAYRQEIEEMHLPKADVPENVQGASLRLFHVSQTDPTAWASAMRRFNFSDWLDGLNDRQMERVEQVTAAVLTILTWGAVLLLTHTFLF